jgi:hypothetical protein
MVEQLQGRRSEQSENGCYSKHGVVLVGKLSEPGRYFRAFHCARASRCCKCRTLTTFKDGPGGLAVMDRLFDAILWVATTGTATRYYGTNEELGLKLFLGAFDGDAVGLARTALADTPPSNGTTFHLHGALLAL